MITCWPTPASCGGRIHIWDIASDTRIGSLQEPQVTDIAPGGTDRIHWINAFGELSTVDSSTMTKRVLLTDLGAPTSLTVNGSHVFWTDATSVYRFQLGNN